MHSTSPTTLQYNSDDSKTSAAWFVPLSTASTEAGSVNKEGLMSGEAAKIIKVYNHVVSHYS